MSIYSSMWAPDDAEHQEGCAVYVEDPPGSNIYDFSGKPCDCGQPDAPLIYRGSHVLPSDDDPRGGSVDLACIPDHITRDGRDDAPEGALKDWLRLSVHEHGDTPGEPTPGDASVVLTRPQVERLRDELTWWLEREETW